MANKKKYASLESLRTFKENIDDKFATKTYVDNKLDTPQYTVDDELSSTSTNPVQNKVLDAEFEAISTAMNALESEIDGKANTSHNHDDRYYTETEIDTKLSGKSDASHNHDSKYDAKGSAAAVQTNLDAIDDKVDAHTGDTDIHVTTSNKSNWNTAYTHSQAAHARTDATKVADSTTNGNILINGTETNVYTHPSSGVTAGTYKSVTVNAQGHVTGGTNPTTLAEYGITDAETKGAASGALASAKEYTDSVASGKANTSHNHDTVYDKKGSADSALASAKSYADSAATTAATKVKNDLLNGAGTAYDTLKELGDLIDDNQDAIDALETVAAGKADKTHSHAISDVSGLQSALDGKAASSHGTHVSYSTTAPVMDGTASVGSASTVARSDHKHPTDTSRASKTEFDSHTANTTAHITSTERSNWNAAKTHADSAHAPSNAEKNQNAFSNITVGSTTVAADSPTDTVTFVGSNVTITPDATNDKVTFAVADGSTSAKGLVQLTNSTSSTSTTTAATPSAVKSAYDLANTAKTNAATAQTRADEANEIAIEARDVEIGGRNLLNNSIAAGYNATVIDDLSIRLGTANSDTYFFIYTSASLTAGTKYTISCDAINVPDGTNWLFGVGAQTSSFVLNINKNGRCSASGVFSTNFEANSQIMLDDITGRVIGADPPIVLSNFKLEKGGKATDWTPSVEHVQSQIDSKLSLSGGTITGDVIVDGVTHSKSTKQDYYVTSFASAGWYRIYSNSVGNSSGRGTCTFILGRSYSSPQNEEYNFSVSVGYNGQINITQLSGVIGGHLIKKIRVVYKNSSTFYIDFYSEYSGKDNYKNGFYVYGNGVGTFQVPTLVSSVESGYSTYEFTTTNGCKSDKGFTGNLTGNADTATKATQDASGNVITSTYATKTELNGKANSSHTHDDRYYTETEIDTKVSTLNTAINGKAASSHTHSIANVSGLQSALDSKLLRIDGTGQSSVGRPFTWGAGFASGGNNIGISGKGDSYYCVVDSSNDLYIGRQVNGAENPTWVKGITSKNIGDQSVNSATNASAVTIKRSSSNDYYPMLLTNKGDGSTEKNDNIYASGGNIVTMNPSTGAIKASKFEGNASTATALTSKSIGSATNPVYFDANGKPVKTTYTLGASVPSNAKFTDTTYSNFVKSGSGAKAGLVPAPSTTAGTTKYLREDGTWAVPPDTNTTYTFNGAVSTIKDSNLTASRALISNSSGKVAVSAVTSTELGYLDGVTSAIQTQLNGKAASSHNHAASAITSGTLAVARGGTGQTSIAGIKSALGITDLVASGCLIEEGTYTGTGSYGELYPSSLTFSFTPKLVYIATMSDTYDQTTNISGNKSYLGQYMIMAYGQPYTTARYFTKTSGSQGTVSQYGYPVDLTWSGNTVSWFYLEDYVNGAPRGWSSGGDLQQMNAASKTYRYIAIG